MQRESVFVALLMSFFIPGLGLVKIGQVKEFILFYVVMAFALVVAAFVTFGLAIFFYPLFWGVGMLHTWLAVRAYNKRAGQEAYRQTQQLEALRDAIHDSVHQQN